MTHYPSQLDHLIVIASTLSEGVAWCEATLGITPGLGGEHPLMGTHNRLFNVSTATFPAAYFEIIAINPAATPAISANARRWFDMDDEVLKARIARHGPELAHWVARVPSIARTQAGLATLGVDTGHIIEASRMTATGLLRWKISVREDGQRLFNGCLPTLIQWDSPHPSLSMPESSVTLQSIALRHPKAEVLMQALDSLGAPAELRRVEAAATAEITATLQTPKGCVVLRSGG